MDVRHYIAVGIIAISAIYGASLAIVAINYHVKLQNTESDDRMNCYHAQDPNPTVENLCLHLNLWKTCATMGTVFGSLHAIFGLATIIISIIYKPRHDQPRWQILADSYIAQDCQVVLVGYHLVVMLLFSYIFYLLLSTKAETELDPTDGQKTAARLFTALVGFEPAALFLLLGGCVFTGILLFGVWPCHDYQQP